MRRSWREVIAALTSLEEQGFIDSWIKLRKVASVTILAGVEFGPYTLAEAYAWCDGCEAMGAAVWPVRGAAEATEGEQ
jgi:hypothetical protein